MEGNCGYEGCSKKIYARGYCKYHYKKMRHLGKLPKLPPKEKKLCSIEGCNGFCSAKGLCQQHYREHKVRMNPTVYKNIEDIRNVRARVNKARIVNLMGGCCSICGYDRNYAALEFHHNDPTKKEFQPKVLMRNKDFDFIMKEINKCSLVCKNCHTEIHHPNTSTLPKNDRPILVAP